MGTMRMKWALAATALVGCGATPDGSEATGSAVAAIETVPSSVRCVRLTLRGGTRSFDVTGGSAARLDLGALPSGTMSVTGAAYDVACADVTGMTQATWVSDPTSVAVSAGITTDFVLAMRPNTSVAGRVDFVTPARRVVVGGSTSYAIMRDGTLRAWGSGPVGDGTYMYRLTPVPIALPLAVGDEAVEVVAGRAHACALSRSGLALCWGVGDQGQLGSGLTNTFTLPTPILTSTFRHLAAGADHTCGTTRVEPPLRPSVLCWGSNARGAIGDGTAAMIRPAPTPTLGPVLGGVVWAGPQTSCARGSNGAATCWGQNSGVINDSAIIYTNTPQLAGHDTLLSLAIGSSHACGLRWDGSVTCAGTGGRLGTGTSAGSISPVTVAGLSNVVQIAAGDAHTCARRVDGTVWCWGNGGDGRLGTGAFLGQLSPARVVDLTGAVDLSASAATTCAVRDDGTIWCWGNNDAGQLGDGTVDSSPVPVRVRL